MQGFNDGINTGITDVQKNLNDITNSIGGGVQAGIPLNVGNTGNNMVGSSTNIYGNITIGSKQDADYFLQRLNRQTNLRELGLAGGM